MQKQIKALFLRLHAVRADDHCTFYRVTAAIFTFQGDKPTIMLAGSSDPWPNFYAALAACIWVGAFFFLSPLFSYYGRTMWRSQLGFMKNPNQILTGQRVIMLYCSLNQLGKRINTSVIGFHNLMSMPSVKPQVSSIGWWRQKTAYILLLIISSFVHTIGCTHGWRCCLDASQIAFLKILNKTEISSWQNVWFIVAWLPCTKLVFHSTRTRYLEQQI